jgi:hypothetical protein
MIRHVFNIFKTFLSCLFKHKNWVTLDLKCDGLLLYFLSVSLLSLAHRPDDEDSNYL